MLDRSQPSTAPADSELRICRPSVVPTRKQTSVRRTPEIKSMGAPYKQNKRSLLGLHYQETVGCGVAVCLTSYSVNAAHADNSSA
jgi:hypothetical protein